MQHVHTGRGTQWVRVFLTNDAVISLIWSFFFPRTSSSSNDAPCTGLTWLFADDNKLCVQFSTCMGLLSWKRGAVITCGLPFKVQIDFPLVRTKYDGVNHLQRVWIALKSIIYISILLNFSLALFLFFFVWLNKYSNEKTRGRKAKPPVKNRPVCEPFPNC